MGTSQAQGAQPLILPLAELILVITGIVTMARRVMPILCSEIATLTMRPSSGGTPAAAAHIMREYLYGKPHVSKELKRIEDIDSPYLS